MNVEPSIPVAASPASLWHRSWRRTWFKRAFYELLGLWLFTRRGFAVLNCGYEEPGYPTFPLVEDWERDRPGFQLYHRLVREVPLAGRDVVEVGCGRGGGAIFLCCQFEPRSYLATDASRMLVWAANRRSCDARLTFRQARAGRVPAKEKACDVGVAVETTATLDDKAGFLAEMARVLRPDGVLLVADFFYARETSSHAEAGFRGLVEASEFFVSCEEDWTGNVVAALESQSPRRLQAIDRLPRFVQPAALSFSGTTRSPLYQQLCDGRAVYRFFRLERKDSAGKGRSSL